MFTFNELLANKDHAKPVSIGIPFVPLKINISINHFTFSESISNFHPQIASHYIDHSDMSFFSYFSKKNIPKAFFKYFVIVCSISILSTVNFIFKKYAYKEKSGK